jgi:hypothetical protein
VLYFLWPLYHKIDKKYQMAKKVLFFSTVCVIKNGNTKDNKEKPMDFFLPYCIGFRPRCSVFSGHDHVIELRGRFL